MTWTDERTSLLIDLWASGLSASQIRDELGDISRNAVIGKVHRLRLEPRESPIKPPAPRERRPKFKPLPRMVKVNGVLVPRVSQAPSLQQRRAAAAIAPPPSVLMEPETQSARCSIMDLRDDRCRWIMGDSREPLEAIYCGAKASKQRPWGPFKTPSCPYCDWHADMAVAKRAA